MQYPSDRRRSGINAGAKKLLASGESWRKQVCSLTLRQVAWLLSCPNYLSYCPPHGKASGAIPNWLGCFRYRVFCALGLVSRESAPVNICSPSPANHNRAPRGSMVATILPRGHSGKSGTQKQVGLFTETWSLGWALRPQSSSQVRWTQFKLICFTHNVSAGFSPSTWRAIKPPSAHKRQE